MPGLVLVVDDLIPNQKLLEAKLTQEFYEVIKASSGLEALNILKQKNVDLILLDVMMPDLDGFEVCKRIKSDPNLLSIPVVMVTALTDVQDKVKGLESGADDFLTKPINDIELFARISSLLRLKETIDQLKIHQTSGQTMGLGNNVGNLLNQNITGANIVIINDDPVENQILQSQLKILEHNITVITDFDNAANKLAESKINYDLIIISITITGINSLRLCSHIHSVKEFKNIPILLLIEEEQKESLAQLFKVGVSDYLVMPVDNNELKARSKTLIRRKKYQDALRSDVNETISMATIDPLTNLFNRRYFDICSNEMLQKAQAQNHDLAAIMTDIDHFKNVNDTYGHATGDSVLVEVAKCLKSTVRASDIIARYGGEEFVILLPKINMHDVEIVAQRLRQNIEKTDIAIPVPPNKIKITISIGATIIKETDTSVSDMVKRADKALYRAKETGRNKVIMAI